jgi:hypothetical protein
MINKNAAIKELENSLIVANDISYESIDKIMRKIMKKHDLTAKELHFGFKDKHNKTPDDWIKMKKNLKETVIDRVLQSLFEDEDCGCDQTSKPVMSIESIAKKHKVSVEDIQKQLKMGIKVEKEHTTDSEKAEAIALQHLAEKPDYYTKLKKVEAVANESAILTDILSEFKKPSKKMKGEDPCWKGYEMVGTKKKRGKTVPNCVPVSEATLPVQNGHVMQILVLWRGKLLTCQLFFPQIRVPNKNEISNAIVKVYPDSKVINFRLSTQKSGEPLIQVPNSRSKNYLLQNKTIGEEIDYLEADGPSLSVGRGEKLPVSRGGGLTAKGREKYNRETGSNLQAPVTGEVKQGSKAWKRRKAFCSRSRSWNKPRGLAARRRWKC